MIERAAAAGENACLWPHDLDLEDFFLAEQACRFLAEME